MEGELRLVGSRGILSQPIVLLFVLHRFVRCHIETVIWNSQTTYCWAVYAPQVCAEPHRDRDMICDSQQHRDRDLNFQWIYVQFRLWKKNIMCTCYLCRAKPQCQPFTLRWAVDVNAN